MFKKYLIIASKLDIAGMNIATALTQFKDSNFDIIITDKDIVANIDSSITDPYDFVIFVSKHASAKGGKTLSIHPPGNWRNAEFGGEKERVCSTSALFFKFMFENLSHLAKEHKMDKYDVTMEATHHGPLINKPCLFAEVGSTKAEWKDKRAAFVMAKVIKKTIDGFKPNKCREIAVGIGGPHYCPNFNKIQLKSNVALSHLMPQYVFPLKEDLFLEAINKTIEEIDFVVLDWKGLGTAEQRQHIIDILEKNKIEYKKVKEIKK